MKTKFFLANTAFNIKLLMSFKVSELAFAVDKKSIDNAVRKTLYYIMDSDDIWMSFTMEGANGTCYAFAELKLYKCICSKFKCPCLLQAYLI